MRDSNDNHQVLRLKTTIVALVSFGVGVALLVLDRAISEGQSWGWLSFWPFGELGGILVGAGILGVVWDYFDGKDRERRDDARVRRILKEASPDFRDAVVQGFAVNSEDLGRVATPELLDSIATNVLALRLNDRDFAREVYEDVRDQAVRAPERWHDVDVRISLSSADESGTSGAARFDVTVQWEYTVAPSHAVQRFACVSDRDEFHELITDVPSTSTWFMTPRPGFDASDKDAFELMQYTVDGEPRSIRRSQRKTGQTYSVNIGEDVVREGKTVRIAYVYKTITPQSGHRLFFDIEQPTKNFSLEVDYTATDISHLSVTDLVSSKHRTRISRLPNDLPSKSIAAEVPGWIFPRAGFAFVWTLTSEEHPSLRAADSAETADDARAA